MVETLYPVFLKLVGRKVVLVGGGAVGATKYAGLRMVGATVTVVAPAISPALRAHGTEGAILIERAFQPTDLDGAYFVIAAAPPEINREVATAAEARNLFVNAVDDKAAASAYLPGIVRSGAVTIAISTSGASPALAGLLREGLEATLPGEHELANWQQEAVRLRAEWQAQSAQNRPPMKARRPALLRALNALYGSYDESAGGDKGRGNDV